MDQFVRVGLVDLTAQTLDRYVHHVGIAVEIHVPDFRSDLCPGQHIACPAQKQMQQGELLVGQHDHLLLACNAAPHQVPLQVCEVELVGFAHYTTTQNGADA